MEKKKRALVTGASSGIGQGTALVLAREGWDVAITYSSNLEGAEQTRAQIESMGCKCVVVQASIQEDGAPERMVLEAYRALGGLDLLVNNAGVDRRNSVLTVTRAQIDEVLNTNFAGSFLAAGQAARLMVRDGTKGSIIFVTSTRASCPHPDDFVYGGSKAAIRRAVQSVALDLAPYGIRVNCVAPGATRVREYKPAPKVQADGAKRHYPLEDNIPLGRLGLPQDNGELIAYLASDKASYITGIEIQVDGGLALPAVPEGFADMKWAPEGYYEALKAQAMERLKEQEATD